MYYLIILSYNKFNLNILAFSISQLYENVKEILIPQVTLAKKLHIKEMSSYLVFYPRLANKSHLNLRTKLSIL